MQLLLDTHIALWAITNDERLPKTARTLIANFDNRIFVSAVNVWEIAIKHALGRETMPVSGSEAIDRFHRSGYDFLDVTSEHAAGVEDLPLIHADPFDRMLVSQALAEPLRLLTHDKTMAKYGDSILHV